MGMAGTFIVGVALVPIRHIPRADLVDGGWPIVR
jgi:hypothetical protein